MTRWQDDLWLMVIPVISKANLFMIKYQVFFNFFFIFLKFVILMETFKLSIFFQTNTKSNIFLELKIFNSNVILNEAKTIRALFSLKK